MTKPPIIGYLVVDEDGCPTRLGEWDDGTPHLYRRGRSATVFSARPKALAFIAKTRRHAVSFSNEHGHDYVEAWGLSKWRVLSVRAEQSR